MSNSNMFPYNCAVFSRTKWQFLKSHCHCEAVIYTIMVCSNFVVEALLGIKVQLYKIF
jgi:sialic acid synthase SpsE